MNKRAILLNGLAILAVIFNHTTSWAFTAMFWWTDRYRPVSVPNYDQVGTLPYYVLLVIQQLAVFSVPAFIFVSGFFISYASRGGRPAPSWGTLKKRIINLVIPYLLWVVVIVIGDVLQGDVHELGYYFVMRGYYFVPLLCQFYLLSPWIVPLAKNKPGLVLWVSAILQWGTMGLWYASLVWKVPALDLATKLTPFWLFFRWAFFFSSGLVFGLHLSKWGTWLTAKKRWIVGATVVLALLAIVEPEWLYRTTGTEWRSSCLTISTSLYAWVFTLFFLITETPARLVKPLRYLAGKTYGIYLTHDRVMEFVARVLRQIAPWILARQILFSPLVFVFGLGTPLLLMMFVLKSPLRKFYKYIFG